VDTAAPQKRLLEYGFNEVVEKKPHPLFKFFGFFWGTIPWMIEIAAILAALIHHWETFYIILGMLLLNSKSPVARGEDYEWETNVDSKPYLTSVPT
jgi:magnesium-transporting ATPase (P-type)